MDLAEKLEILADSAKYDVACTSSGVRGKKFQDYLRRARRKVCDAF